MPYQKLKKKHSQKYRRKQGLIAARNERGQQFEKSLRIALRQKRVILSLFKRWVHCYGTYVEPTRPRFQCWKLKAQHFPEELNLTAERTTPEAIVRNASALVTRVKCEFVRSLWFLKKAALSLVSVCSRSGTLLPVLDTKAPSVSTDEDTCQVWPLSSRNSWSKGVPALAFWTVRLEDLILQYQVLLRSSSNVLNIAMLFSWVAP